MKRLGEKRIVKSINHLLGISLTPEQLREMPPDEYIRLVEQKTGMPVGVSYRGNHRDSQTNRTAIQLYRDAREL
jgi:hypothetical protein